MTKITMFGKYSKKSPWKWDPWLIAWLFIFALLAWGTWGKLEIPIYDVGRDIEITTRLLGGELLYRDLGTYYGPIAYYANAAALLLFGQRLEVFFLIGFCLSLIAALLFYHLGKRFMDARWAALCTIYFLVYCAIGPHIFNFIVPYNYGSIYATVCWLSALVFFDNYMNKTQVKWLIATAVCCGLTILAKQEYGIAIIGGVLVGVNLYSFQTSWNRVCRSLLILAVVGIVVLLPLALLARQTTWAKIFLWLTPVSKSRVLIDSGILDVSPIKTIRHWSGGFRVFIFISYAVVISVIIGNKVSQIRLISKWNKWGRFLVKILIIIACYFLGVLLLSKSLLRIFIDNDKSFIKNIYMVQPLEDLSWSFPLIVCTMLFRMSREYRYGKGLLLWTLLVFSVLLNGRWLFHITFYGLYAPPIVLMFFTLAYKLSERIKVPFWHYLMIFMLIGAIQKSFPLRYEHSGLTGYHYEVNSSHGSFYTKDAALAHAFNKTIDAIKASEAKSVLVLPEGNILNFLSGTHSPSREMNFIPGVLPSTKAEREFIEFMENHSPELIVYVDVPFYFLKKGYQVYAEYNPLVHRWITQEHELVYTFPISPAMLWYNEGVIRIYK